LDLILRSAELQMRLNDLPQEVCNVKVRALVGREREVLRPGIPPFNRV
jgi:hypothetical protein